MSIESIAAARQREVPDLVEFRQGDVQQPMDPTLTFDLIVGPDHSVYVVDDRRDDIQRFGADGRYLATTRPVNTPASG